MQELDRVCRAFARAAILKRTALDLSQLHQSRAGNAVGHQSGQQCTLRLWAVASTGLP